MIDSPWEASSLNSWATLSWFTAAIAFTWVQQWRKTIVWMVRVLNDFSWTSWIKCPVRWREHDDALSGAFRSLQSLAVLRCAVSKCRVRECFWCKNDLSISQSWTVTKYINVSTVLKYTFWVSVLYFSFFLEAFIDVRTWHGFWCQIDFLFQLQYLSNVGY